MKSTMTKKPHPIDVEVGHRMREVRKCLKMSQSELGERIGVTFQQIQKYERGENRMGASRLQGIATALGVEVSTFFPSSSNVAHRSEMINLYAFYRGLPLAAQAYLRGFFEKE